MILLVKKLPSLVGSLNLRTNIRHLRIKLFLIIPKMSPTRDLTRQEERRLRLELQNNQLKRMMIATWRRERKLSKKWMLMFLEVSRMWESLDMKLRDRKFQKIFARRNLRKKLCPSVLLIPLTFHEVSSNPNHFLIKSRIDFLHSSHQNQLG